MKRTSFAPGNVSIEWFGDGTTNVSLNCIDRHLAKRADQVAIIWEGDDPGSRNVSPIGSCTMKCAALPMC